MAMKLKAIPSLFKETASEWIEDKAPRLGAALAYYTIFSISPLIVIVLAIAGLWLDEEIARKQIFDQISGLIGTQGSEAIQSIFAAAQKPATGVIAAIIAVITLLIGATGVFVQLQDALNTIWEAEPKAGGGLWGFVKDRLLSFAMILGIGFLLLVSLILSAVLTGLGKYLSGFVPGVEILWQVLNFLISLGVITVLFAMIFKIMPNVKIAWHDVWIGAVVTALLFNIGKSLLGLYLAKSSVASAYGAAGSIVIILVWVYYSSQIVFFGAEFTQVYANKYGSRFALRTASEREAANSPVSKPDQIEAPPAAAPPMAGPVPVAAQSQAPLTTAISATALKPRKRGLGVAFLVLAAFYGSAKVLKYFPRKVG